MKSTLGIRAIEAALKPIYREYEKSRHFEAPASIYSLVKYAEPIVSIGNETGEGVCGELRGVVKDEFVFAPVDGMVAGVIS